MVSMAEGHAHCGGEGERYRNHADFVMPGEAGCESAHSTNVMLQCNTKTRRSV